MISASLGAVALAIWLVLWLARSGFWRIDREPLPSPPSTWPDVSVVIPARNEADVIGETLNSLLSQDYPGRVSITVADDHSNDGTAEAVRNATCSQPDSVATTVTEVPPLPPAWTGKVWAMHSGLQRALVGNPEAPYVLLSDADIHHAPCAVRELVTRAESGPCDLVSFMVRLRCDSAAERLMIPAFVFFFKMLYPFRSVNDPNSATAGAAGGTMLVRREALERIGGLESIRSALIDDCALAARIKSGGHRIWLGLSDESASTRSYGSLSEIVRMIARTAYTQLDYSPIKLTVCVLGLALTFLAPPALLLASRGIPQALGGAAWLLMSLLYLPMLRFYRQPALVAPLLPVTAAIYLWASMLSAWQHYRGHGGQWKGRSQDAAARK